MSAEELTLQIETRDREFAVNISQTMPLAGVTAVFGPSGAGKTTLMRMIAGFDTPDAGRIALDGDVWFDADKNIKRAAWSRPVGYMFQDGRLFPHLTVRGNLQYADKRSAAGNTNYTFEEIVNGFDLSPLLDRRIQSLSGGERQRAALARTLLVRPQLLLLDEPLAALDRKRKTEILPYIKRLSSDFGAPTIFISHDIEEVSHLADRVMVLANGGVQQYGTAPDIVSGLDLEPLTGRHENVTLLEATIAAHDTRLRLTRVSVGEALVSLPMTSALAVGSNIRLRIRAQDVAIATAEPQHVSIRNVIPGKITEISTTGASPYADVLIDIKSAQLRAQITRSAMEALMLEVGKPVFALVKSVSIDGGL
ncbi:molybdenum ABC transporter ATP-binding protein [Hyphococcus sp.]|uniref:molybdenum ABC transporter ATP-binding protein n=1 Tax=Hyphococcus sp. TaxID=2038636 RepID=UPI003CCC4035